MRSRQLSSPLVKTHWSLLSLVSGQAQHFEHDGLVSALSDEDEDGGAGGAAVVSGLFASQNHAISIFV